MLTIQQKKRIFSILGGVVADYEGVNGNSYAEEACDLMDALDQDIKEQQVKEANDLENYSGEAI